MPSASGDGQGRLVAIVGGGNGIGAATARLLHRRGWRIAVADIAAASGLTPSAPATSRCRG